jgi:RHS repeat-associated protein
VGKTVTATVTVGSAGGEQSTTAVQTVVVAKGKPFERSRPALSGTARDGQTLTAAAGAWTGSAPIGYAWQWQRCSSTGTSCASIAGATGVSYVLQGADIAHTIRAALTATNAAGTTTSTTDATAVIAAIAPHNETAPTVDGTAIDGERLTAAQGAWTGSEPLQYSYQWQRCNAAGAQCDPIAGADRLDYRVTGADIASGLRIDISATNAAGTAHAVSTMSAVVAAAPPLNTDAPVLAGPAEEGHDLSVTRGTWSGTMPLSYAYQWRRCTTTGACSDIPGATGTDYTLTAADVGQRIAATVTATNATGVRSAAAAQTAAVTQGAPVERDLPLLSGTGREGQTLTATSGRWTGTAPIGYAWQWLRCSSTGADCTSIAGATDGTYVPQAEDVGQSVRAQITATNPAGSATTTSAERQVQNQPCTTTFQPTEGAWDTAANWSTAKVPSSSDDVCVPAGRTVQLFSGTFGVATVRGAGMLAIHGGTLAISNAGGGISKIDALRLAGGTLDGAGDLTVTTALTLTGGTMAGAGQTVLASTGTGSVTGGTLSRTLVNEGALTASAFPWYGTSAAVLDNRGTFTTNIPIDNGWGMLASPAGATPQIRNSGTFTKTSTSQPITTVDWQIDNTGTVESGAGAGEIWFGGGSVSGLARTGSWSGARLTAGTFTWGAGTRLTGPVTVRGATVTAPDVQGSGDLGVGSGTLSLTDASTTSHVRSLSPSGGVLGGAGDISVSDGLNWNGGTMSGAGRTILAAGVTGSITGGTLARTLVNRGAVTAAGSSWYGTDTAVLQNEGTFTQNIPIDNGMGMLASPAGATPQIRNSGSFRKTASAHTISTVDWQIDNSGSVQTTNPTDEIYFSRGGVPGRAGSGSWGNARLTGGTFGWGTGTTLTGPVNVAGASVDAPDVQAAAADLTIGSGSLNLTDAATTSHLRSLTMGSAGTLTGDGDLDVSLGLQWGGGVMSGTGRTTVGSDVVGSVTGGTLSRTLVNRGSLTASGGFSLLGTSLATLENYGRFTNNVQAFAERGLERALPGATPRFDNYGTLQKTANGYAYSNVGWQLNNFGTVRTDSDAGELFFLGGSTPGVAASGSWSGASLYAGGFTWGPGTRITGNVTPAGATIAVPDVQGDGRLRVSGGTLELTDATTTSHIKDLAVENGGMLAGAGSLTVSGSFASGGSGTLATTGTTTLAPTVTGTISGGYLAGRLTNNGRLTFSQGRFAGRPGGLLDNEGILDLNSESWGTQVEAELAPQAVLWNRGLIRKTSGLGKTIVDWAFADQGVVQELSGHLYFTGPVIGTSVGSDGSGPGGRSEFYGDFNAAIPSASHCDEADPVNCVTGDFYEDATDLDVPGRGRSLEVSRTYNAGAAIAESAGLTNESSVTRLGPGWTHPYATHLELPSGYVVLHGANGATATFKSAAGGTFTAAERVKATLAAGANGSYVLTYKDQTKDVFGSTGRLLRMLDRNGYATTLTYDAGGRIDHVSDEAGRRLSYSHDAAGRIATITDPAGRRVAYDYDARGDLVTVTDVAGESWRYGYDDQHRIVSMRDARGHETVNVYDSEGRVIRQTDAGGAVTRFAYTATSTTVTNARGYVARYEQSGGLTSRVVRGVGTPQEAGVTMVRDASGNVTQRIDPDGQLTKVSYDAAGNATKLTDPLNRVTTMTYSPAGDVLTVTDPQAVTTTFSYDDAGNTTRVSNPLAGTSSSATRTAAYDPDRPGDLLTTTDATGHVWRYGYDADGNRTSVTDPEGGKTTIAYNAIGWPTSSVSPRGNVAGADPADFRTTIAYDDLGQPTSETDPLGAVTRTGYDAVGNVTSVTDPGSKTTATSYDELDRPTVVTRADGSTLRFAYDAVGNRTSVTDGLGHETTSTYDALDRETSQTDAKGRTTRYGYDHSSRQTALTDEAGRVTTLAYDLGSQLRNIDYSDGQTPRVSYDYDSLGRRSEMADGTGTSTYAYDSLGRLTSATDGRGRRLQYAYDLAGRITKIGYPADLVAATAGGQTVADPSVRRTYDGAGRMVSITDWLGHRTTFDHDVAGNTTAQSYANGTTATFAYDHADRLTRRTDSGPGGASILDLPYARKLNGQLQTRNRSAAASAQPETLTYDALDQLEQASTGSGAAGQTFRYAHDVADRLTQINTPDAGTTLQYDAANQLVRARDTATGDVTEAFGYDELGNRTSQDPAGAVGATAYGYDQAGRLTHYRAPAASAGDPDTQRSYNYDGDGLRADLLWDTNSGLGLVVGDSAGLYVTGPDGLPLAQLRFDGTQRYYHHDQIGSTRALTTADGTVAARSDYDPYGNPTTAATPSNPFGYAGQYTDHATGLIYMRARWYDPATGQFITSDPIGHASGETNLYRYAAGDPANFTDPSGLSIFEDLADARDAAWDSLSDKADEAVAFYAAITVDPCASSTARAGAWVGGILSSLATHANRDTTLSIVVGRGGRGGRELGLAPKGTEGRLGGVIPNSPRGMSREQLETLRSDLRKSIDVRGRELVLRGNKGSHGKRLAQEARLLRQVEKALGLR